MPDGSAECERAVARLSRDLSFGRFVGPGSTVHAWSVPDGAPLWSTAAGGPPVGDEPTLARLAALAAGSAPASGFRLERLAFGGEPAALYACRRAELAGGGAVVTALVEADREPGLSPSRRARFLWQADVRGRLTAVSESYGRWLGPPAEVVGRTFSDLDGGGPGGAAILAAIGAGRGWPAVDLAWPDAAGTGRHPVVVGGTVLRSGGTVAGFRGFGLLLDPGRATLPEIEAAAEPVRAMGTFDEPRPPARSHPATAPSGRRERAGEGRMPAEPPAAAPGVDVESVWRTSPRSPGLSVTEHGALHEIARALGARLEPSPEPPPTARPSADILALPRPRNPEPARLLDRLPVGIAILREGVPVFANRHLLHLLGAPDLPSLVARGGLAGIEGRPAGEPRTLTGADGTRWDASLDPSPVTWGEMPASLLILREAASEPDDAPPSVEFERQRARLAEAEAALAAAADAALTLDGSGRILSMSPAGERSFDLAQNEIAGEAITTLIHPDDHLAVFGCLDAAREREGRTAMADLHSRAGLRFQLRAEYRHGEDGDCFLVALHDVSRFAREERALEGARRVAEQASHHQTEFLARVSHEIRTPLNAIIGFADLMASERFGPIGSDRYRGYLHDIQSSGAHVLSLVNDLLDLAKITSGRSELTPRMLDLNRIAAEGVGLLAPLAARERTILRTSFAPGLPGVVADERSMRQVVLNVLSNAIRYTGAGGQTIVSTAANEAGQAVVHVRDTGPGMTAEEIEAALTPMRQVISTRRSDGTGLGLPLSKALVEANGGSFVVTSARGRGTLIEIRMPAVARAG